MSKINTYAKKRDCNVTVPLPKALVLPSNPNKQHESPRYYVFMYRKTRVRQYTP